MIANRTARSAGITRWARGAALVCVLAVTATTLAACATTDVASAPPHASAPRAPEPQTSDAPEAPPAPAAHTGPAPLSAGLAPTNVAIPAIELVEPLIDLGIGRDGSMEVPSDFDDVGWFTGGGKPGGIGPTVIAGHVDSRTQPAVFFRLGELAAGDAVQVTDSAGTVHDYEVYRVAAFPKNAFPTVDVFGALPGDELRLITCTGQFDTSIGHYDDNLVVYAAAVG